eukprot:2043699-Pyramimonas_sp.AAC.1
MQARHRRARNQNPPNRLTLICLPLPLPHHPRAPHQPTHRRACWSGGAWPWWRWTWSRPPQRCPFLTY